jgi:hypothetical protein
VLLGFHNIEVPKVTRVTRVLRVNGTPRHRDTKTVKCDRQGAEVWRVSFQTEVLCVLCETSVPSVVNGFSTHNIEVTRVTRVLRVYGTPRHRDTKTVKCDRQGAGGKGLGADYPTPINQHPEPDF